VGEIWFKYLKETGIAFCGEAEKVVPSLGYLKKGSVYQHNAQMLGKEEKTRKKKKAKFETEDDILELSSQISQEEFYQGMLQT
jgi:hypothetical protein